MSRTLPLAHGWSLAVVEGTPAPLVRDFIRPAVLAVPAQMARRIGFCRISLVLDLGSPIWTPSGQETIGN
jgi:hypothetical protein